MKFNIFYLWHFGFGITWQRGTFRHEIYISLPVVCLFIGIGKNEKEKD